MPLIESGSKEAVQKNTQKEIEAGKDPKQAYAIAKSVQRANDDSDTSARQYDHNGWYEIENNPLSRAGVFEYLGAKLGRPEGLPEGMSLDPSAFYNVLRAPEELSDPTFLNSLRLTPWIIDHEMLGPEELDLTPAEEKGVHGVIGEKIYYNPDDDTLYGNIKSFSSTHAELIDSGKNELSLGYRCRYVWDPGVWRGQPYQIRQITLRGNHVASVDDGRMGAMVAVLDSQDRFVSTFDAKDFKMADNDGKTENNEDPKNKTTDAGENGGGEGGEGGGDSGLKLGDVQEALKTIAAVMPLIGKIQEMAASLGVSADTVPPGAADGDDDNKPTGAGMDEGSDTKQQTAVASTTQTENADKEGQAMDAAERKIISRIARRDALAARLKPFVPGLDHSAMTERELALAGCKALGVKTSTGGDPVTAIDAYLQGRASRPKENTARPGTSAMDAKDKAPKGPGLFSKALEGKKG